MIDKPDHAQARDGLLADLAEWMSATGDALLREEPRCPQHARVVDRLRKALG
ncbi:MAG: hypothetical protein ACOCW3_05190 [Spirochaetota bacterium]